jgi:hypothetical protein
MKAEVIQASGYRYPIEPENGKSFTLQELRRIVGGTIDIQRLPKTGGKMVLNDDGKIMRPPLPVNQIASKIWQKNYPIAEFPIGNDETIVGDVLISDGRWLR